MRILYLIRRWSVDAVTLGILCIFGGWLARGYLGASLIAWGDHPGQFMRFWYPLTHAIPNSNLGIWGVIGWNPTWYAGYPEIQFYPPGTTLLGIILHYLALGRIDAEQLYNYIPALAFALPLLTCYIFMRYALAPLGHIPSALAGIAAGLLAIVLKPMWGGIDGVLIGLMGERLAFGFAPVVLLTGWMLVEKPTTWRFIFASLALASLLLLHPFHAPALVVAVGLYALARLDWRATGEINPIGLQLWHQVRALSGWLLLSIALVAWWVVPLLAHYTPNAAALVRANTDQVITWFDAGRIEWLWLAGLMALMLLAHPEPRIVARVGILALLAPLLVAGILINDRILLTRFGITVLDPIRFIAEYYLALIFTVAAAVAAITSSFLWRIRWLAAFCTIVVIVTLRPYVELAYTDLRSHVTINPHWKLDQMLTQPTFDGYWDALRDDPTNGRVFFVSNYLQVINKDGTTTPTTVNSLTPYFVGREIVGGTFSHWSPIARWLWVGDPYAALLPAQVESGDARQIFGKSWDQISTEQIAANLTSLNVTTVVANSADQQAITSFEASPHFARYWHNDAFVIFHLVSNPGSWVAAEGATVELVTRQPLRWTLQVNEASPGASLRISMSYYPLWRASVNGTAIPITATAENLLLVDLPTGAPYQLDLAYLPGLWEWLGLSVTLGAIGVVLLALARLYWTKSQAKQTNKDGE